MFFSVHVTRWGVFDRNWPSRIASILFELWEEFLLWRLAVLRFGNFNLQDTISILGFYRLRIHPPGGLKDLRNRPWLLWSFISNQGRLVNYILLINYNVFNNSFKPALLKCIFVHVNQRWSRWWHLVIRFFRDTTDHRNPGQSNKEDLLNFSSKWFHAGITAQGWWTVLRNIVGEIWMGLMKVCTRTQPPRRLYMAV